MGSCASTPLDRIKTKKHLRLNNVVHNKASSLYTTVLGIYFPNVLINLIEEYLFIYVNKIELYVLQGCPFCIGSPVVKVDTKTINDALDIKCMGSHIYGYWCSNWLSCNGHTY